MCRLIIVDYLQLLRSTSRRAQDNRQFEISEISAGLKGLAKELKIPIIVVAQLNRQPEQRTGGKPRLSDLRESGSIEQDADLVGLLVRPEIYEEDEEARAEKAGEAELIIAKQRNGPVGEIPLTFLKEFTRFEDSRAQRERAGRSVLGSGSPEPPDVKRSRSAIEANRPYLSDFAASITCCASMPRSFITSGPGALMPKSMQSDHFSVETDIFIPNLGHAGFDRDAFTAFVRQHFFAIFFGWRLNLSKHGMETTRTPSPSSFAAASACCNSLPHDRMIRSSLPVSFFAM